MARRRPWRRICGGSPRRSFMLRMRQSDFRRHSLLRAVSIVLVLAAGLTIATRHPRAQADPGMTVDQVMAMPKIDAHAHLRPMTPRSARSSRPFSRSTTSGGSASVRGGMNWERLKAQIAEAEASTGRRRRGLRGRPRSTSRIGPLPDWDKTAAATIADGFKRGAVASRSGKTSAWCSKTRTAATS